MLADKPELTKTERAVFRELAKGLSQKEIGAALFNSPMTVNGHVRSIHRKFGTAGSGAGKRERTITTGRARGYLD